MIQLICIDVDGTLVGSSGTVLPDVWPAVARARAAGVRLAICSGRPAFGATRDYAERLDDDGWHVFQNGASVVHLPSGRSRSRAIGPDLVAALVRRARETNRVLELYTDTAYAFEHDTPRTRAHARLLGVPYAPRPFDSLDGAIVRAQWLVGIEDEAAVLAEPHPGLELAPSTSPIMPGTSFVNVTAAGVNKATAVRAVADAYGISLERVMFVGDGHNDVGAMREVGLAVAMGNAEPSVRAVATRSVADVDDGGLVEALGLALARPAA